MTTIPAAANIGVAAAYGDGEEWRGAMLQLSVNLAAIVLAGVVTLFIQRKLYQRRRRRHLSDASREAGGLPVGRSLKSKPTRQARRSTMSKSFDALVIGAGPAGEVCAGHLADGGLKVAIAENELVAGECSYWACMPSKTLLRPG